MRFLITRPKPDANVLAKRLQALGHKSWLSPVMKIDWIKVNAPDPTQLSGLVITSRNALRSLEKWHDLTPFTALPLFAVGKSSAASAAKRGFTQIYQASGRADTLPALIKQHLDASRCKTLYHPGGRKKAYDLAPALGRLGFGLMEQTVYETQKITRLAPAVIKALNTSTIDGILLLSPRSAQLFADLVRSNKLEHCLNTVSCLCLSQNVAQAAYQLNWGQKLVSSHPNIDQLLDLIDQIDSPQDLDRKS